MQRHQYQTRNQVMLSHLSQLLSAVRTTDGHMLLHLNFCPHWWPKWDNNCMYLILPKM